jgi:hypothetical protein
MKTNLKSDDPLGAAPCCASSCDGYRLLKPGERLQKHDEGLHEEDGKWHEVGWLFSKCDYVPGFMVPIRRKCDCLPTQRTSTDCFSACLSWLLRLPQDEVPDFTDPEDPHSGKFYHSAAAWLNARGLRMMMIEWRDLPAMLGGPVIARGTSPRENAHAVLWDDDGMLHDPHPSRAGLVGEPTHAMLILSHNTQDHPPKVG